MKIYSMLLVGLLLAIAATAADPAPKPPDHEDLVYELPKEGTNQSRADGGWINADMVGTRFVVKFFDKNKKPIVPDVERGFALFKYSARNPARAPLNVDGMTLATPGSLRSPHNFLVILSLFVTGTAEPTETYTFRYP